MKEQMYLVEMGYGDESGSYYSPMFVTANPKIADELNVKLETYLKQYQAAYELHFKTKTRPDKTFSEKEREMKKEYFGDLSEKMPYVSEEDCFIISPIDTYDEL